MRQPSTRPQSSKTILVLLASLGLACGNLPEPCKEPGACVSQPGRIAPPTDAARPRPTTPYDGGARIAKRAILVSVDALGAYYLGHWLALGRLPNFAALGRAGAFTLNARTDWEYTVTLPNHTSMLTGRPVSADPNLPDTTYHGWTSNSDVDSSVTLHNAGNPNLSYIASVFDVLHDHGLSTCLYSGKTKFSLFANSYNPINGAPDTVGEDDGRGKIDRVAIMEKHTDLLVSTAVGDLTGGACDFAFIHLADLDWVGHELDWGGSDWFSTLETVDGWLGRIAALANAQETSNPFALVVTADHGGVDYGHSDATLPIIYTIPFYVVGPGIPANTDLYTITGPTRADPGEARPRYSEPLQPVRDADAANVITSLLGLPPVPGSFMRDLLK